MITDNASYYNTSYGDLVSDFSTGGSSLGHTAVKPNSHLAHIFFAKFPCIIMLIIIIG